MERRLHACINSGCLIHAPMTELCAALLILPVAVPFGGSGCACEGEQPLHIIGHRLEVPFAADVVGATEQKLVESEHRFDGTEYRLGGVLA